MNDLILEYLFAYHCCPLPGIGELRYEYNSATHLIADKKIISPSYEISLLESNVEEEHFVKFIAGQLSISFEEARQKLQNFCNKIINSEEEFIEIEAAGKFYVNADGNLKFEPFKLPPEFTTEVDALRISRQDVHQILVGDTQSTSVEMAGFYNSQEQKAKSKWWLWALLLLIIAAVVFVFYMNDSRRNENFGNASEVSSPAIPKTYDSK